MNKTFTRQIRDRYEMVRKPPPTPPHGGEKKIGIVLCRDLEDCLDLAIRKGKAAGEAKPTESTRDSYLSKTDRNQITADDITLFITRHGGRILSAQQAADQDTTLFDIFVTDPSLQTIETLCKDSE